MGYLYAALWIAIGLILIFSIAKEHKVFYFAGGFFLLLGVWWLADSILAADLFGGAWGMALRIVTLAALVVTSVVFFVERQKMINKEVREKKAAAEGRRTAEQALADAAQEDNLRAGVQGVNIMRPRDDGKPGDQ